MYLQTPDGEHYTPLSPTQPPIDPPYMAACAMKRSNITIPTPQPLQPSPDPHIPEATVCPSGVQTTQQATIEQPETNDTS